MPQPSLESKIASEREAVPFSLRPEESRSATIFELLTQLALRKRFIAIVTGCCLSTGLVLCFALPARYTAVAAIMPPKPVQSAASFLNGASALGILGQGGGTASLLTDPNAIYMGLLRSRPVADGLIDQFHLEEVYRAKDRTDARDELAGRTVILSEPSTLISISVTDGDSRRAAELANAYTEQLRQLTGTISMGEAARRRLFFEDQIARQKEALLAAELAFEQVQQGKGLVQLDAQAKALIGGLAILRSQIAGKQVELQRLLSYSTEHNPEVQLTERELSALQGEATQMEQDGPSAGYGEVVLKDVPKMGGAFIQAQRELQYQQALFDILLRQYEAAKLDEARESSVIQVVQPAVKPDRRSSPHRLAILAISLFAGWFLGCVGVLLRHRMEIDVGSAEGAAALSRLKHALTA